MNPLDAAYNNTAAVADSARFIEDWDRRSAAIAARYPQYLDLRYGPRERNRVDYFAPPGDQAPVLVFIHGGYWQMRAKETFRFLAQGPLAHGVAVAFVGYTLAPEATLTQIVEEIARACSWLHERVGHFGGDADRMYASGWSAGGHLTAISLAHPAVRGGLAISGIYDLEPLAATYINEKLRLSGEEVQRLSPARNIPGASPPLVVTYGTGELPELQRQSREFGIAWLERGLAGRLRPLPGHHHFSILEELASPAGALTQLVLDLIRA